MGLQSFPLSSSQPDYSRAARVRTQCADPSSGEQSSEAGFKVRKIFSIFLSTKTQRQTKSTISVSYRGFKIAFCQKLYIHLTDEKGEEDDNHYSEIC